MAEPARPPNDKFARYRARKREKGLKLLRMWVPDTSAPGFQQEVDRQMALLRAAPEQDEMMDFLEAVQAADGWPE